MPKVIQLTTNSWLIRANTLKAGLLFKLPDEYVFMSTDKRISFATYQDVEKRLGKLEVEPPKVDKILSTIRNYPIKHSNITIISEDPPLYKKNGNTVYAAGYWGLKFQGGWTQAYCPKHETCEKYETVGPFSNRLEMLNHISKLNTISHLKNENV